MKKRVLTADEFAMYAVLGSKIGSPAEREKYRAQLQGALVSSQTPSHTTFVVAHSPPLVDDRSFGQSLDAFYEDGAGIVNLILHFADGRISWAERFHVRTDPEIERPAVTSYVPKTGEIRLTLDAF